MFRPWQLRLALICSLFFLVPTPGLTFDYLQPLPDSPLVPSDNPMSEAKVSLGKKLFFDPSLLGPESTLSCNSCHMLSEGGDDGQPFSTGQKGKTSHRSSPGLWNIGLQTVLYWDGRSTSLEEQTLDHLRDPVIATWPSIGKVIDHLNQFVGYKAAFKKAFPESPEISGTNVAKAIATFERSLMAPNSPFDRFIKGETSAISASAKRGIQIFNDTGCLACHFGVNFAGPAPGPAMQMGDGFYELFPNNLGTKYQLKYHIADDKGRYEYTGLPSEKYMWRVPPLRNIELTAPYFHNGSVATLEEAIRVMARVQTGKVLSGKDVKDVSAFLRSLTGITPQNIQQQTE